jgi:hypothetical protein
MKLFFSFILSLLILQPLIGMDRNSKLVNVGGKTSSLLSAADEFLNAAATRLKEKNSGYHSDTELEHNSTKKRSQKPTSSNNKRNNQITLASLDQKDDELRAQIKQLNKLPATKQVVDQKEKLLIEHAQVTEGYRKLLLQNQDEDSETEDGSYRQAFVFSKKVENKSSEDEAITKEREEQNKRREKEIARDKIDAQISGLTKDGNKAYHSGIFYSLLTFGGFTTTFLLWKYKASQEATLSFGMGSLLPCGVALYSAYSNWKISQKIDALKTERKKYTI